MFVTSYCDRKAVKKNILLSTQSPCDMALSTYEKYEQYWQILQNNQEMIRFSEVKAGLVISIYGILFSILLQSTTWIHGKISDWPWYLIGVIVIFIVVTLTSLFYAFKCFMPRFENKNPTSVIYFGDIVHDFEEYTAYHSYLEKAVVNDSEMSIQLAEQIHTNSSIATRKFNAVSKSIKLLFVDIFLLIFLTGLIIIL